MKKTLIFVLLISFCGSFLAGCGRKGAVELPSSSMIENDKGEMVEKPKEDKPFILDSLIR